MNFKSAAVTLFFVTGTGFASAQVLPPQSQLPDWAVAQLNELTKQESIEVSARLNPFVWRGDFDGDGKGDLAILVKDSKSNKEGIVFLFRAKAKPVIVGAGRTFGNGGDDFSWLELWYVEDKNSLQHSYHEKPVKIKADGLIVAKEGSASALIYVKAGKAMWQQQGD